MIPLRLRRKPHDARILSDSSHDLLGAMGLISDWWARGLKLRHLAAYIPVEGHDFAVPRLLLLKSPARRGADAELVDTLSVFPCGDSACKLHDGLARWCAVADDGSGAVESMGERAPECLKWSSRRHRPQRLIP